MENLKKLSLPLEEIFIERKWGAGLCAFVVYAALRFLLYFSLFTLILVSTLRLFFFHEEVARFGFYSIILMLRYFMDVFIIAAALFDFYRKRARFFRLLYTLSLLEDFIMLVRLPDSEGISFTLSILIFAVLTLFTIFIYIYATKSKALKRYFGEE